MAVYGHTLHPILVVGVNWAIRLTLSAWKKRSLKNRFFDNIARVTSALQ
jgi:hypothetical protein